jgi:hypothetical protein
MLDGHYAPALRLARRSSRRGEALLVGHGQVSGHVSGVAARGSVANAGKAGAWGNGRWKTRARELARVLAIDALSAGIPRQRRVRRWT